MHNYIKNSELYQKKVKLQKVTCTNKNIIYFALANFKNWGKKTLIFCFVFIYTNSISKE